MYQRTLTALAIGLLTACACRAPADEADDQFNFATGLFVKNEYALAVDEFNGLLQKHPTYRAADVALYRLGEALGKLNRNAEARAALEKLAAGYPQSEKLPQALYRLGQLVGAEDHRAAAQHYATVAAKWPANPLAEAARYWSAEELFKAEDWPAAAAAYAAALQANPAGKYAPHALYSLGWSHFRGGNHEAALTAFRQFLEKHGAHELAPECKLKVAECLHKLKRFTETTAAYTAAQAGGGKLAQDAATGLAWSLYDQGKPAEAAEAFVAAAALLGQDAKAAVCLFNAGNAYVESKACDKAGAVFARVVTGFPQHELVPEATYWQGYCLLQTGNAAAAVPMLEGLRASGKLKAREVELLQALADARLAQQDFKGAAETYAAIGQAAPQHKLAPAAAYGRMLALEKAGDLAGAIAAGEAFFAAYAKSDLAPLARFALGEYRFRQGAYKESAVDFEQFLAGPHAADLADDAQYKRGWCALNLKDPARARIAFAAVVTQHAQSPLAPEAAFLAGRAAEEAGDKAAAAQHYGEAAAKWPDSEHAQRAELALAFLELNARNFDGALARATAFLQKRAQSPLAPFAHLYQAEALLEQGKLDEALAAYQRVGAGDSGPALDAAYGIAWVHRRQNRHAEAAAAFAQVAAKPGPKAPEALFWQARALEDAGQNGAAAARFGDYVKAHAATPLADEAAYRVALCTFKDKRLDDADKLYTAFLAERGKSPFADNAAYDRAWLALERKQSDQARAGLEQVLRDYPQSELTADVRFRLGELAYERRDFTNAVALYQAALAQAGLPFADKVLYKLGWAQEQAGQLEPAGQTFARLAKEFAQGELADEANYRVGRLLQKAGRQAEAQAAYAAVRPGPFADKALFQKAESHRLASQHKEALEAYGKLLAANPPPELLAPLQLGRGHCLRAAGAFKDALEAYAAVVKATDTVDAGAAVLGEGYVQFAQGAWAEAAKAFLKVDILYGYDELKPEALSMLAKTWEKAGDAAKGKQYREELKRRYPQSPFAKE